MDQLFIGIDSGTQGTKVVVLSEREKRIVAEASATYPLIEGPGGKREQDPRDWIIALEGGIAAALRRQHLDAGLVRAIGVSGQQHGMVALDASGNVIRPAKLWCDTETKAEAEALTQTLGGPERVIALMGNAIAVGFTASKILWLKKHEPAHYARLATVLLPHDYLNFYLTGEKKTECGDASGTAYFDIRTRQYAEPVLQAIDPGGKLPACLPALIPAHEPVGTVRPAVAAKLGLRQDVVVSAGGGDNMMAAIGTGNVAPGIVTTSLGTSGTIYCFSEQPVVDPRGELAAFCSSDGHWLPLVCTMNVTVSTEVTRALLGLDVPGLNRATAAASPGAGGMLLLPFFNGERTPALPTATATLSGLTPANFTPDNLCRAAMEGATFGLRYGLDVFQRNGIEAGEIRLVGGGAKSKVWRQLVADVFNCPVVCPQGQEAGALGAALQALWCYRGVQGTRPPMQEITAEFVALDPASRCEPLAGTVEKYRDLYARYLAIEQTLRPTYA